MRCWFDKQGYGFIILDPQQGETLAAVDVFVHRHALHECQYIEKGQRVTFEWGWNVVKQVWQAAHVRVTSQDS